MRKASDFLKVVELDSGSPGTDWPSTTVILQSTQ